MHIVQFYTHQISADRIINFVLNFGGLILSLFIPMSAKRSSFSIDRTRMRKSTFDGNKKL